MLSKTKRTRHDGTTANKLGERLYYFILNENLKDAILLIGELNCNVNWVNHKNWTPLIIASRYSYYDVIKTLLKRQDLLINHQNLDGNSALLALDYFEFSFRSTHVSVCLELFINDARIDVNLVNKRGRSALWWAYRWRSTKNIKLLISHGAKVHGITESVFKHINEMYYKREPHSAKAEATAAMKNWKSYLSPFKRYSKTNKYYPLKFKQWAFNFILCCLRDKTFNKDLIYLLLEYVAEAWKLIK